MSTNRACSSCAIDQNSCRDIDEKSTIPQWILLFVVFLTTLFIEDLMERSQFTIIAYLAIYVVAALPILLDLGETLVARKYPFNENGLIFLATVGAFYTGKFEEAIFVVIFFRAGELLQSIAEGRSRRSIRQLLESSKSMVNLIEEDGTREVEPELVKPGERILIKPGEKVLLDCRIIEGSSNFDTSALTGESLPRNLGPGEEILAGYINLSGVIKAEVIRSYDRSATYRILDLVESAMDRKAKTERFIRRFAEVYTPIVMILAVLIALLPLFFGSSITFEESIYRACIFLVISCPCALVISIPLSYYIGVGTASSRGVIVKGASFLELLGKMRILILDKTGTITRGRFSVDKVVPEKGTSKKELLVMAAIAEQHSDHPIARSIVEAADRISMGGLSKPDEYREIPGMGIVAKVDGREVLVGNDRLVHEHSDAKHPRCLTEETGVNVVEDGIYKGYILVADTIR